eukprot:3902494-Rhodomonas_salina.1
MAAEDHSAVVGGSEGQEEGGAEQAQTPGEKVQKEVAETTPSGGTWLRENLSKLKKKKDRLSTQSGDSPAAAEQAKSSGEGGLGDFLAFEQEDETPKQTVFGGDFISFDDVSSETKKRKAEIEEPLEEPSSAPASQVKKAKSLAAFVDRRSPWSRGQKYQTNTGDATVDLHLEILDFVAFISPTKQEIKRRTTLVELFESI